VRLILSPAQPVQIQHLCTRALGRSWLLHVSGLHPLFESYVLIQPSDSVAQRTLTTGAGVLGTIPACLDACYNAGKRFGGVEYGG